MIGSIDILASINSNPMTSMATTGRLSGICDHPACAVAFLVDAGRLSSLMKTVVAMKVRKMTPPASQNVPLMPISGGSAPPISGPTRLPAMMPDVSMPSAHPERAFGVCVATRIVEPEA